MQIGGFFAPAALSAFCFGCGVASSGLYQVMKSSDEVYDFSDNAAIESAKATAKPSASGLDDYVGGRASESSPRTTSAPRASSVPEIQLHRELQLAISRKFFRAEHWFKYSEQQFF